MTIFFMKTSISQKNSFSPFFTHFISHNTNVPPMSPPMVGVLVCMCGEWKTVSCETLFPVSCTSANHI